MLDHESVRELWRVAAHVVLASAAGPNMSDATRAELEAIATRRHSAAMTASAARVPLRSAGAGAALIEFHRTGTPEVAQPKTNNLQSQSTGELETLRGRGNGSSLAT